MWRHRGRICYYVRWQVEFKDARRETQRGEGVRWQVLGGRKRMKTVLQKLMIALAAVSLGGIGFAAEPGLDAATRKEAEATLARGKAWLQAQSGEGVRW